MQKEIVLALDKETKGTVRYRQIDDGDDVRFAYLKKQLAQLLGSPREIRLTVRAA